MQLITYIPAVKCNEWNMEQNKITNQKTNKHVEGGFGKYIEHIEGGHGERLQWGR